MRKFITHNDTDKWLSAGTHLIGHITCNYEDIVEVFGKPNESDGYKSDAGWDIKWNDGTVSTIYNWKNGNNYNNDGTRTESIVEWNVGGKDQKALNYVLRAIKRSKNGHQSREQLEWMMDSIRSQTGLKDII
jgi:hypothetical protein